jgi:topoisomerase-4 subunit A
VAVWKKGDERTTYNLVYLDGKTGISYAKRFNVSAVTRNTEYDLTQGNPNSKIIYFTANQNGESELVTVLLSQGSSAKIKNLEYDFATLSIKGRNSQGNIVTKFPVRKISQKTAGKSTLGAKKIWYDEITSKLNEDGRGGILLGEFDTGDLLLLIYKDGHYEICEPDMIRRFDINDFWHIGKFDPETIISTFYFDGIKEQSFVKRFKIETVTQNDKFLFISEHKKSQLLFASIKASPRVKYSLKVGSKKKEYEIGLAEVADVKSRKAMGNKISDQKPTNIKEMEMESDEELTVPSADELQIENTLDSNFGIFQQ